MLTGTETCTSLSPCHQNRTRKWPETSPSQTTRKSSGRLTGSQKPNLVRGLNFVDPTSRRRLINPAGSWSVPHKVTWITAAVPVPIPPAWIVREKIYLISSNPKCTSLVLTKIQNTIKIVREELRRRRHTSPQGAIVDHNLFLSLCMLYPRHHCSLQTTVNNCSTMISCLASSPLSYKPLRRAFKNSPSAIEHTIFYTLPFVPLYASFDHTWKRVKDNRT